MTEAFLHITGKVQGVFYRDNAQEKANALGLCGWVKNMPDGSVSIVVQGKKDSVEDFIAWCHDGSPSAEVEKVQVSWQEPEDLKKSFEIES